MRIKFLSIIVLSIILIASCSKEQETSTNKPSSSSKLVSDFQLEQININKQTSKENLAKIMEFKDRMKSGSKEVVWLTDEEAQWLIDACANYDYARITNSYPKYEVEEFNYLIPISSEGISSEDLEIVYAEITADIENIMANLGDGNQIEIQNIIVSRNTIVAEPYNLEFGVMVFWGFYPNENVYSAANNDYWYWGKGLGRLNGQDVGEDATTQITYAGNSTLNNFYTLSNYTFTSNEYLTITYDDVPYTNAPYLSRIWNKLQCNLADEPYLTPTEMNEFLNHALYVAQLYKPAGKMIKFVEVDWNEIESYSSNNVHYGDKTHSINVIYGIPNL